MAWITKQLKRYPATFTTIIYQNKIHLSMVDSFFKQTIDLYIHKNGIRKGFAPLISEEDLDIMDGLPLKNLYDMISLYTTPLKFTMKTPIPGVLLKTRPVLTPTLSCCEIIKIYPYWKSSATEQPKIPTTLNQCKFIHETTRNNMMGIRWSTIKLRISRNGKWSDGSLYGSKFKTCRQDYSTCCWHQ